MIRPTDSELEILQILWERGSSTVREVHELLDKKDVGYTSTLKLMQIMLEKNLVQRDSAQKSHTYTANIDKDKTEHSLVNKFINHVFKGSTSRLVMQALGNQKTSQAEIDEIKQFLENLEEQSKKN